MYAQNRNKHKNKDQVPRSLTVIWLDVVENRALKSLTFPEPLSRKRALKTPLENTPVNISLYSSLVLQEGCASGPEREINVYCTS